MNFRAKLRRSSPIYRHWTNTSKIGGEINGVRFRKEGPRDFVSAEDPLSPDSVAALLNHPHVELEIIAEPVASVIVIEGDALGDEDDAPETEDGGGAEQTPGAVLASVRELRQDPVMRRPVGRPPKIR